MINGITKFKATERGGGVILYSTPAGQILDMSLGHKYHKTDYPTVNMYV